MTIVNQTGESKKSSKAHSRRQGTITNTPTAHDKIGYRIRYTLPAESQKNGKQNLYTILIFLRENFIGAHLKMRLHMLRENGNLCIYQNIQKMQLILVEIW